MSNNYRDGLGELEKNMQAIARRVNSYMFIDRLHKIGNRLKGRLRAVAPVGETGNLKKGFVSKRFRSPIKGSPATFVAVNYGVAPHYHLVEYGHKGPKKDSEPTPPHDFAVKEVEAFKPVYLSLVEQALKDLFR